jgi:hypothetical protein
MLDEGLVHWNGGNRRHHTYNSLENPNITYVSTTDTITVRRNSQIDIPFEYSDILSPQAGKIC